MEDKYVIEIGNRTTFLYRISNGMVDVVKNPITGRELRTVVAITQDSRFFSGFALSSSCPYEGRIAYNFVKDLGNPIIKRTFEISKEKTDEYTPRELLSYFLGNVCDSISPRPKSLYIAIPKWWNHWMRQDLNFAAQIANIKLEMIDSVFAHTYAFYNRNLYGISKDNYVGLIEAGETGFDISFSKVSCNGFEELIYKHFNVGGEFFTDAIANMIFEKAYENNKDNKEKKKFLDSIKDKTNLSQRRIFYLEAQKIKEDISKQTSPVIFDPKALMYEIKELITYEDVIGISEIKDVGRKLEKEFEKIKNEFEKIKKENEEKGIYAELAGFEINGGGGLFSFFAELIAKSFKGYKITYFLDRKDPVAAGAAHYVNRILSGKQEMKNEELKDGPYDYDDEEGYLYEIRNHNVLKEIIKPTEVDGVFSHDPCTFKEKRKVCKIEENICKSKGKMGIIEAKNYYYSDNYFEKERKRYEELNELDKDYRKVGEYINYLQGQTLQIDCYKEKIKQSIKGETRLYNEVCLKEQSYKKMYQENCNSKKKTKLDECINKIKNEMTDIAFKAMEHLYKNKRNMKKLRSNSERYEFEDNNSIYNSNKTLINSAIEFAKDIISDAKTINCAKLFDEKRVNDKIKELRTMLINDDEIKTYNDFVKTSPVLQGKNHCIRRNVLEALSPAEISKLLE